MEGPEVKKERDLLVKSQTKQSKAIKLEFRLKLERETYLIKELLRLAQIY